MDIIEDMIQAEKTDHALTGLVFLLLANFAFILLAVGVVAVLFFL